MWLWPVRGSLHDQIKTLGVSYILVAAFAPLPQGQFAGWQIACNHLCFADVSTSGQIYIMYSIYGHQHVTNFLYMT